jgi:hypothetical protein
MASKRKAAAADEGNSSARPKRGGGGAGAGAAAAAAAAAAAGGGLAAAVSKSGSKQYDRAICQLLLASGTIESKAFEELLGRIKEDFGSAPVDAPLEDTFKRINTQLRKSSMEIRSVRSKNDEGVWIVYYGLVNTEEDFVSKEHGMRGVFDEAELRFFSTKLLPKIVSSKYLTTGEVNDLVPKSGGGLSKARVHELLTRLRAAQWLGSSDRGFWELGPRTFLELRSHVESILKDSLDENLNEEERAKQLAELKEELPQVIYF